jgi:PDZ domain-containing secreted protein
LVLGKRHIFVLSLFCLFGSGCTFHSNQLEALKTILWEDSGPEPQWVFSWEGLTEKVFAVNAAGTSIFFANSDGILVHFNGVFVEKIEGVRLNSGAEMDISITKTKMDASEVFSYRGATSALGDMLCDPPKESIGNLALKVGSMQAIEYTQKCLIEDRVVEQTITLNQSRQLMGLQFFVHPARQPVTIRHSQIKDPSMY